MLSRLAVLLLLMLPIASTAQVFRCPDEDGASFTDQSCPDGEPLDIDPHPGGNGAG
jgi:hypothetical protein